MAGDVKLDNLERLLVAIIANKVVVLGEILSCMSLGNASG
jgi:hypothetical protein